MTNQRLIELTAVGTLAVALGAALLVPPEQTQGDLARMLFVHVPSIWLAYVAFVAYVALVRRRMDLALLEDRVEEALTADDRAVAGDQITAPLLRSGDVADE